MLKGCEAKAFLKFSNDLVSLLLLLLVCQSFLNTVEKGVRYISHILSKNKIEGRELAVMISRSTS